MLLFQKRFHEGLKDGSITLTFRSWDKPLVKPGGRYRCHPIGVVEVDSIRALRVKDIAQRDAKRAGFGSKGELLEYLASGPKGAVEPETELWRVELHYGGDGDRVEGALDERLSEDEVAEIRRKRARMDAGGSWTDATFALIDKHPRDAASQLAAKLGRETAPFQVDVRNLKKLGLTQSFEVGYEISPRGRAYLRAIAPRRRGSGKA